ncbi:hypothetical protein BH695_1522 [Microcystis aeruginosa PCC 7806SL]|uniref:Uncharacterized protein n=1 Tax=Microcystis aeruginosa PCC 7806SL TaxID=1903187 RepID=A0AB33BNV4_MICA7|nr:hypothetical protein BH695_1522 [Microcystis aeruginosa PCC 7806SL]
MSTPTVKGEFFLPSIAIPDWSLSNLGVEKDLGELRGFAENFFERCGQGCLEYLDKLDLLRKYSH